MSLENVCRPSHRFSTILTIFAIGLTFLSPAGCSYQSTGQRANEAPAKITTGEDLPSYEVRKPTSADRAHPPESRVTNSSSDPGQGAISVFFSQVWDSPAQNQQNPRGIQHYTVQFIEAARKSLDVCCFEINNGPIINAIVRAHRRGIKVRVVTETDYLGDLGPQTFKQEGIQVISDERSGLMHNKFIIADDIAVWTGSFNFTDNCAWKNNNNGLVLFVPKLARNYSEVFRWFWEYHDFGSQRHSGRRVPFPIVRLEDGTLIENYFSPGESTDIRIISRLRDAKKSIKFLAFSFTHREMAAAMLERAQAGVLVQGVFETRQVSKSSEFEPMKGQRNVDVRLDGNSYQMHHKVILIDNEIVVTGSYNFSTSATIDNNENCLIIHSPAIARIYEPEFQRVFSAANTETVNLPKKGHSR